jgi:hypothetical protein
MGDADLYQVTSRVRRVQQPPRRPASITALRRQGAVEWDGGEVDRVLPDTASLVVPRARHAAARLGPPPGTEGLAHARAGQVAAWDDFDPDLDPWSPLGM